MENSRLDYGNDALRGLPANLMHCLRSVLNASVWLIFDLCYSNCVSDTHINCGTVWHRRLHHHHLWQGLQTLQTQYTMAPVPKCLGHLGPVMLC